MTTAATLHGPTTTEELLALPDDGMERYLIRGRMREKEMTRRNKPHSIVEGRITTRLGMWLLQQPEPRGEIVCGEAGFILRRNPDSTVGVDVAYISAAQADSRSKDTTLIEGAPILVVEVLSPNDTQEEVDERVADYLDCGVGLVWIVYPRARTVTVYRPATPALALDVRDTIAAEPHLPGFSCPVAAFFR